MSNTTDEWAWLDEFLDIGHDREDGTEYRSQAKQSIKSHLEQMMREREQAIQLPQFFIEALINGLHKEAEYYREAGYKGLPHNFQNRMNKLQALTKEEDK